MAKPPSQSLTQLLTAVGQGDDAARSRLWKLVYGELHTMAKQQMVGEAPGAMLQTTALVHDAFLRLTRAEPVRFENRRHFFAAAARAMRQIRIDDARKRRRVKRGRGRQPSPIEDDPPVFDQDPARVLAIDEALKKLEQSDPRKAEVVSLRYFGGLTGDETAEALELSPRTVDNEWRFAKAWLHRELSKGDTSVQ